MKQAYSKTVTVTAAAIQADIDLGVHPKKNIEIFVECDQIASYQVYGSVDGVNFLPTNTINLAAPGSKSTGYLNAFRHLRVASVLVADHRIVIAGA